MLNLNRSSNLIHEDMDKKVNEKGRDGQLRRREVALIRRTN